MKNIVCWMLALVLLFSMMGSGMAEEINDYAAAITLNMASETVKTEASVKTYVDGDTTHFIVPESVMSSGVLKARYLAINTPETTGKIEEYGKKAADFTREKLSQAVSIILESDDGEWNPDSTSERHLVWVWYKPAEGENYRNLNIELLQNGLAIANASFQNRYGSVCMNAISQAKEQKLNVYSGQKDPDFYYGEAIELTLKELRTNPQEYNGKKVAFKGVITTSYNNTVYVEDLDPETGLYFGMPVYYGYNLSGKGLDILSVGNESRIVGTMQYYEAGASWQVSGLTYRMMKPKDPGNIQLLSSGHQPAFVPTEAETFAAGSVTLSTEEGPVTYAYAELALATSVSMQGLAVKEVYTTDNADSSSNGALTLTCEKNGATVLVRTAVLRDADGQLVTGDAFLGKTISVKGVVDYYEGAYQIRVLTMNNIIIE